jgi:hypothetical protein
MLLEHRLIVGEEALQRVSELIELLVQLRF